MNTKMAKNELLNNMKLYVLISSNIAIKTVQETARLVIEGGADVIQLREKTMSDGDFISFAREICNIIEICRGRRPPARQGRSGGFAPTLIINDRVNVAKEVNADGVHLGQHDMGISEARDIIGNDKIIGISTHNIEQARQAQKDGADYIAIGPIYHTETKVYEPPVGPGLIQEVAKEINIPFVAIGAITLDNLEEVLKAGATSVAVCSAIISSKNILSSTKQFKNKLSIEV